MAEEDSPWMWPVLAVLWAFWVFALFSFPTFNTDLYWHLNFGRWILRHGAVPRSEFLSSTMFGAPWVDFEWLTQAALYSFYRVAGCMGLMAWRAGLLLAACAWSARTLALYGAAPIRRALACLALLAAALVGADVRADNVSLAFFAATLHCLEAIRIGFVRPSARLAGAFAAAFALWANFHLGVSYGLLLIGIYALGSGIDVVAAAPSWRKLGPLEKPRAFLGLLAAAAAGTLANPFGWRLYRALWDHARVMEELQETNLEWSPAGFSETAMWPFWILFLCAGFFSAAHALRTRRPAYALLLALCYFGISACLHQRHIPYFALTAVPAAVWMLSDRRMALTPRVGRVCAWALTAGLGLFSLVCVAPALRPGLGRARCLRPGEGAAIFLAREAAVLSGKRLYHPVDWGGFFAYAIAAPYPVFFDGRYIFHELQRQESRALGTPSRWAAFLDAHAVEVACLPRIEPGPNRGDSRPLYATYMPRRRWALVYWDDLSMVFVRRGAVPDSWLRQREYRHLLPSDYAWTAARLRAGAVSSSAVRRELDRRSSESGVFSKEVPALRAWLEQTPARARAGGGAAK